MTLAKPLTLLTIGSQLNAISISTPTFIIGKNASAIFCNAVTKLSFSVEIRPCKVWLCASRFPKNIPPSEVAALKAKVTMSALIAPFSMAVLRSFMDIPVFWEIIVSGLKP